MALAPRRKKTDTRGLRVISFIETYCRVPEGTYVGDKMKLDLFQKKFICDVYDNPHGTSRGDLSIARKNGKTGLIAGIVLAHDVGPEAIINSQIISGARSRDQAALVFKLAWKMINFDEDLQGLTSVVPSGKTIWGLEHNVEYRAISAEGKTAHGLSPILAILDETGQVRGPQDDFIDAIVTAQGAHNDPLILNISTQAPSDNDLLSIWLDDAENSGDPKIVSHVYSADEEADILDRRTWAQANPALGTFRSEKDMANLAEMARRMPSFEATFRNLNLNQRVEAKNPFVPKGIWSKNGGEVAEVLDSDELYGGLDLSATTDLTALMVQFKRENEYHYHTFVWTPEDTMKDRAKRDRAPYDVWADKGFLLAVPGKTIDYDFVAVKFMELVKKGWNFVKIGFDRWRIDIFKAALRRAGASEEIIELFVPFGQGFKDMSPAVEALEADLLNGRVRHGMHPVLTACAANTVTLSDPAQNRKLDKKRSNGRIDAMVAMTIAKGVSIQHQEDGEGDFDSFLDNPITA